MNVDLYMMGENVTQIKNRRVINIELSAKIQEKNIPCQADCIRSSSICTSENGKWLEILLLIILYLPQI